MSGKSAVVPKEIEAIINAAARAAAEEAVRKERREARKRSPFQRTEKKLYSLSALEERADDTERKLRILNERGVLGLPNSRRFVRPGSKMSPEERVESLREEYGADLDSDRNEIEIIREALKLIENDPYYFTVKERYLVPINERLKDDAIAAKYKCDKSTVYRNRLRLVEELVARFYGAAAVE
jgi:hypothetical protein